MANVAKKDNQITLVKKETVDMVEVKINQLQENGMIHFPKNYSASNALRSAWLILQETVDRDKKPVLEACTKTSIYNALLDTVIQGLSPAKKQVYYIAYGKQLQCTRSYFGTIATVKRLSGVEEVSAQVIYKDDEFEFEIQDNGYKKITKHFSKLGNIDNEKIVGAYAKILKNGKEYAEVMTMKEIRKSWTKSKMQKNKTHDDFTQEMAKRTVINRLSKWFFNVSDDSDLLIESVNRSTQSEYNNEEKEIKQEITENANTEELDFDSENVIDTDYEEVKEEPQQEQKSSTDIPDSPGF